MKNKTSILLALLLVFITIGVFLVVDSPEQSTPVTGPIINAPAPDKEPEEKKKKDKEQEKPQEETKADKKEKVDEQPVPETIIEDIHVIGLGDSLTKGSGDKTDKGYIQPVSQYIRESTNEEVSLKNFGIHGYPSNKLVKKMQDEEVQKHIEEADYVFVTIGGNDILDIVEYNFFSLNMDVFDAGLERYRKNLFVIIQSIRSQNPDAEIYLVGIFNPFHNFFQDIDEVDHVIEEWNNTIELVAELNGNTTYIPVQDLFIGEDSKDLFSSDKLHPNHQGYLKMAERIEEYIALPVD
ncbi:GDSL-type esterase/lipase family protein [Alkalihalobacillus sp. AL-G]|uniref:GDSL-type esterase/lipase family protein n=1 Tax=Alkalihalobacillus sp. AL-G TaxID=2926399 RepID=UPI00272A2DEA|nr:GDSL-type esterase/lipase family protein [Alkalihalobacillus sp. AL-G]WLD95283.1 GDSL-type esterase/lipase family protein [Alkalihalobacillus sp. AL-G]